MKLKRAFPVAIAAAVLTSLSQCALATSDWNKTIDSFGSQNLKNYLYLQGGPSDTACSWGVVYLPEVDGPIGKSLYATAITAYSSGMILKRIDYTRAAAPSSDTTGGTTHYDCTASLLQF